MGQSGEGGGEYTRAQFNGVIAESVQHNAFYKLPKAISKPTFFSLHRTKTKRKKKAEKAQTKIFAHSRLLTGGGNGEGEVCSNGMSRCGQINAKCYAKPNKVEHKHTHAHRGTHTRHSHTCTYARIHSPSPTLSRTHTDTYTHAHLTVTDVGNEHECRSRPSYSSPPPSLLHVPHHHLLLRAQWSSCMQKFAQNNNYH